MVNRFTRNKSPGRAKTAQPSKMHRRQLTEGAFGHSGPGAQLSTARRMSSTSSSKVPMSRHTGLLLSAFKNCPSWITYEGEHGTVDRQPFGGGNPHRQRSSCTRLCSGPVRSSSCSRHASAFSPMASGERPLTITSDQSRACPLNVRT